MPRNGSGVYSLPPGSTFVPNTLAQSSVVNGINNDLATDLNTPRPIVAGGTGASNSSGAQAALSVDNKVVYTDQGGAYLALPGDNNAFFRFSTTVTLSLTASATLGANWHLTVMCDAGNLTIDPSGAELINGAVSIVLSAGQGATIICDGTQFRAVIFGNTFSTIANRTHIAGLTTGNNSVTPASDIDIGPGECVSSDTSYYLMTNAGITKRLDTAWVVGSGNGGLDTGSVANTDYHIYMIMRPDTGIVDAIFSASAVSPALPTSYTRYRRIGSIKRQGGAIALFTQFNNTFLWQVQRQDLNAGNPGTAAVLRTLTVPSAINVEAIYSVDISSQTTTALYACLITNPTQTDTVPSYGNTMTFGLQTGSAAGFYRASVVNRTFTNTAGQIRQRFSASDVNMATTIMTHGWVDARGQG